MRIPFAYAFFASLLLAVPPPASATDAADPVPNAGSLDALGPGGERLGSCPLEHTDVDVQIAGFVARIAVTQRFANPFGEPIEAIYTFPLSERAAVDSMWMRAGDRTIRGEIHRREKAREIYERARAEGKLAGLLDQERPNMFTQSLANLLPGQAVEVHIEYVEPLPFEDGTFTFSFPTVVGPRFIPGQPSGHGGSGWAPDTDRVPDASRITPPVAPEGTRAGHDVAIAVAIDAGVPIRSLDSRLHEIDVERPSSSRARVTLRRKAEIPNRDFVLRYAVAAEEVTSGYLVHRDGEGPGYASFVLLPPERVSARSAAPKEMIFVIDRSGSQNGLPLTKAKETMLWILEHMNPDDTFQVVSFSNRTEMLFERPERASLAMKRRARSYIGGLHANGGTWMAEAVRQVASIPADRNRLRVVVFMTDGYIGNDFEVLSLVRELRGTSRWFPFGTGNSVNRFLLDGMAKLGGGEVEYVLLNAPGEEVAKRFYERIAQPVLTDVRLEFEGLDVVDVFPQEVADVWARRPLFVQARYREAGRGRVILRGFRRGEPYEQVLDVRLPARHAGNAALSSMWARAKVDELMSRDLRGLQTGRFPDALREEIVELALDHRLLTQFTSFVAVEEKVVNRGGVQRRVTVPVEMPQGVTHEGVFGAGPQAQAEASAVLRSAGPLPANGRMRAVGKAKPSSQLRALGYAVAGDEAPTPAEPEVREAKEEADLSDAARQRLAPEILALFEGEDARAGLDVVDGRVKVRVLVKRLTSDRVQALEKAGLRVSQRTAEAVLGRIATERLGELAELGFVVRIEPA
jgi:Ca-activated chloride channel family protein